MLLGTLGASVLRNMLTGKGIMRAGHVVVRAETGYNATIHMGQIFSSTPSFR